MFSQSKFKAALLPWILSWKPSSIDKTCQRWIIHEQYFEPARFLPAAAQQEELEASKRRDHQQTEQLTLATCRKHTAAPWRDNAWGRSTDSAWHTELWGDYTLLESEFNLYVIPRIRVFWVLLCWKIHSPIAACTCHFWYGLGKVLYKGNASRSKSHLCETSHQARASHLAWARASPKMFWWYQSCRPWRPCWSKERWIMISASTLCQ